MKTTQHLAVVLLRARSGWESPMVKSVASGGMFMLRMEFLSLFVAALFSWTSVQAFAQVNVQLIPFANGCKGAVIYNNTNHVLVITLNYIYEGQGGSYYSGQTVPYRVNPRSNYTEHWLFNGPVDCAKPYSVRPPNVTYIDLTEQEQAAQKKQDEEARKRNEEAQAQRDAAEALRRQKEQERLAAIKREKEERERGAAAFKRLQEEAAAKRLADYRKASPENAQCIINEPADIARCEQWKARMRAEKQQEDAAASRQREIDASRQRTELASVEGVARAARDMEMNNCSYGAGAPTIPVPANATEAERKRIDAMNWEISQKFFRETQAASDACDLRMGLPRSCLLARQDAVKLDELRLQAAKAPSAQLRAEIAQWEQHHAIVKAECTAAQTQRPAAVQVQTVNNPAPVPQSQPAVRQGAPSTADAIQRMLNAVGGAAGNSPPSVQTEVEKMLDVINQSQ